jgi:hypothetical protein
VKCGFPEAGPNNPDGGTRDPRERVQPAGVIASNNLKATQGDAARFTLKRAASVVSLWLIFLLNRESLANRIEKGADLMRDIRGVPLIKGEGGSDYQVRDPLQKPEQSLATISTTPSEKRTSP